MFPKSDPCMTKLPTEICFNIFRYLDLNSIRRCRLVSRDWKVLTESSRKLSLLCDLTNETMHSVMTATTEISAVSIHDFDGNGSNIASGTRGIGRILGCVDSIILSGTNMCPTIVPRLMTFAIPSVKTLAFSDCRQDVIHSVIQIRRPFQSLHKLMLTFKTFPTSEDTFILQGLSQLDGPVMPVLKHFEYNLDLDSMYVNGSPRITQVLENYVAVGEFILRFKDNLKVVKIIKNGTARLLLFVSANITTFEVSETMRDKIQACVDGFLEMKLTILHIDTHVKEGNFPWVLEKTLMRNQISLEELRYDMRYGIFQRPVNDLGQMLPTAPCNFTTIQVSVRCGGVIDLGLFSTCVNLKLLWLFISRDYPMIIVPSRENFIHFSNVETLPTSIVNLHFKSNHEYNESCSILKKSQMQWIISNLRQLESLWVQLLTKVKPQDLTPVRGQRTIVNAEFKARVIAAFDTITNIDAEMFRELRALPKLTQMKIDFLKAGQLARFHDGTPRAYTLKPFGASDLDEFIPRIEQRAANVNLRRHEISHFRLGCMELSIL